MKAIANEVFFRDPFFQHFSVFAFVPWWIIKLKAGWHPHTASQVWNTKDNSRSRGSLLSSECHICLSPLGFLLLTAFISSLCVPQFVWAQTPFSCTACSDSCLARNERNCTAGPGAMAQLAERQNVLPRQSCGHWPGPALAKAPWSVWISSVGAKIKLANILPHHITSTAELVCWNWEF